MGYVHDLIISGLMDYDQKLIWASRYLSAMAKALLDDAELGMMKNERRYADSRWPRTKKPRRSKSAGLLDVWRRDRDLNPPSALDRPL